MRLTAVLITGDYAFYRHSGFVHASDFSIRHRTVPDDHFLAAELVPGALHGRSGIYDSPAACSADMTGFYEFDRTF